MAECNFYEVYKILDSFMNRGIMNNQIDKVTSMYYSFLSIWPSLDMGQVSRWINGKKPISPAIAEYYSIPSNQEGFPLEIRENLLPVLVDTGSAAKALYDLVIQDDSLSWEKRDELIGNYEGKGEDWQERFFADILYFAACRPVIPSNSKTMKLAEGMGSPKISERIRGAEPPMPVRHFSGREEELEELHERLLEDKVVFIQGIAGIGKSELSRQYARVHKKEYTNILHLVYSGDLRKDIANLTFADDQFGEDENTLLERHHRYLKTLKGDSLLVIDNFDVLEEDEPFFTQVMRYSCRILFTTRCLWEDYSVLHLGELEGDQDLFDLIFSLYPKGAYDPEGMKRMADLVHRHTLAVELCTRLLARGVFSLDELMAKLEVSTAAPDTSDNIRIRKDGEVRKQTYYKHISMLFSLLELQEDYRSILGNISMVPSQGIDRSVWIHLTGLKNANGLNDLIDMGLIHLTGDDRIGIHPLIRELIYEELRPDEILCKELCEEIRKMCLHVAEDLTWRNSLMEMIQNIVNHMETEGSKDYLTFLQDTWPYMQKYNNAKGREIILRKMEAVMKDNRDGNLKDIALFYDYCANTETDSRINLQLELKAAGIIRQEPVVGPATLNIFNNLMKAYFNNNMLAEAGKCAANLAYLYDRYPEYKGHDYLIFMMNYGVLLLSGGDYQGAIEVLEVVKEVFESEGLSQTQNYSELLEEIALAKLLQGNMTDAKKYLKKGCSIFSQTCVENPEEAERHRKETEGVFHSLVGQRKSLPNRRMRRMISKTNRRR